MSNPPAPPTAAPASPSTPPAANSGIPPELDAAKDASASPAAA
jgi:hypothetical protein